MAEDPKRVYCAEIKEEAKEVLAFHLLHNLRIDPTLTLLQLLQDFVDTAL